MDTVSIIFCSDAYIRKINKKFLGHGYFTDTISFLLSSASPMTGEIYISIDSVQKNAEDLQIPYHIELVRVIIHSCLHLCGYTDKTKISYNQMHRLQESYLKKWDVSRETFFQK